MKDKNKTSIDAYDKSAGEYTRLYFDDLSDSKLFDEFLSLLKKGSKILDVGCGPGNICKYIKDKGFEVEGIDLSEEMIKIAKKKLPKINFKVMDMRNLKYNNNVFDGLLVSYSLIHIPQKDINKTIKGFYKILKTKGKIQILVQKGKHDHISKDNYGAKQKTFINLHTLKSMKRLLVDNGFKVLKLEQKPTPYSGDFAKEFIHAIAEKQS